MVKNPPANAGDVCGARGGFLPKHDEDLREPLVRRQGSQVSMRVAFRPEGGREKHSIRGVLLLGPWLTSAPRGERSEMLTSLQ